MSSIIKVNTVQDVDGNNIINENANTITIGKSGDTIQVASGASLVGAGIEWQSVVTAATFTAVAGRGYPIDTSSNACTVTLPAAASVGDQIIFTDYARYWYTNSLTINPNSLKYQGNTTPQPNYNTSGESVHIVYMDVTKGWIPINDGTVQLETPQSYSADLLVVAGGGSGGGWTGGGGGAGGYRTSTQTFSPPTVYTVTVGDGGAARSGSTTPSRGNNGSDSSISGSGLTTITSTAGGGGGGNGTDEGGVIGTGQNGGSGGGGGGYNSKPAGSGDTPATVPSQGNDGSDSNGTSFNLGGGGGAGAVGGATTTTTGGNGGAGTASSITGASVTYAGGGGGHSSHTAAGTGGAGGGGAGSTGTGSGVNGTANTGGGGGGMRDTGVSGTGGKGVVIVSVPDGLYSGNTTGTPTVQTNAGGTGKTVMTFTGDGTYTS